MKKQTKKIHKIQFSQAMIDIINTRIKVLVSKNENLISKGLIQDYNENCRELLGINLVFEHVKFGLEK